jgi:hypothetical protein
MSWSALPWWVYECESERCIAMQSCAFPEEFYSGTLKTLPMHVILMHPATFSSYKPNGWNYEGDYS